MLEEQEEMRSEPTSETPPTLQKHENAIEHKEKGKCYVDCIDVTVLDKLIRLCNQIN